MDFGLQNAGESECRSLHFRHYTLVTERSLRIKKDGTKPQRSQKGHQAIDSVLKTQSNSTL